MSNPTQTTQPETTLDKRPQVELFTEAEHVVLAGYLEQEPLCETELSFEEALKELRIPDELESVISWPGGVAVANIVLKNSQAKLPQFAGIASDRPDDEPLIERVRLAREIRPDPAQRQIQLLPQHLFTINWATSGPGFSWPEAYYATWVPFYEAAILTLSSDCPEVYGGFCDLAIGSAEADDDLAASGVEAAAGIWQCLVGEAEQSRWESVQKEGLVRRAQAEAAADEVWGPWDDERP